MNKENETIIRALNKYGRVPEVTELLNQIEQLQQENKRLKEEYVMLQNASDEVEEKLQKRIDKVIDKLTTEQLYTNYTWGKSFYEELFKELLKILEGEENE